MPSPTLSLGDRILKVNHAGENGAVAIYRAQIAAAQFSAPSLVAQLSEFKSHEERHRSVFEAELARRGVHRCKSYWLCAVGGSILGFVTGLMGKAAIAATTVAVESVVLRHLRAQCVELGDRDPAAVAAISSIVAEETEHHDASAHHLAAGTAWPRLLMPVVAASTESVIWLGMRL